MGLKLAGGSAPRPLPQSNCNYLFLFNYRLPMNKYILPALICFNIYCLIMFYFILFHLNLLMLVGHMSDKCLISAQLCGGDPRRPPCHCAAPFSCIQTQLTGDVVTFKFSHWCSRVCAQHPDPQLAGGGPWLNSNTFVHLL